MIEKINFLLRLFYTKENETFVICNTPEFFDDPLDLFSSDRKGKNFDYEIYINDKNGKMRKNIFHKACSIRSSECLNLEIRKIGLRFLEDD